jgi:hypothetical protein
VMKFLFAQRRDGNFVARFANRSETHDILQCPSDQRIEPVSYCAILAGGGGRWLVVSGCAGETQ